MRKILSALSFLCLSTLTSAQVDQEPPVQLDSYQVLARRGEGLDDPPGRSLAAPTGGGSINATDALLADLPGLVQHDNGVRGFTDPVAVRGLSSTPLFSAPVIDLRYGEFPIAGAYAVFTSQPTRIEIARKRAGTFESAASTQPGGQIVIGPTLFDSTRPGGILSVELGNRKAAAIRTEGQGDFLSAEATGFISWARDNGRLINTTLQTEPDPRESIHGETRLKWQNDPQSTFTVQLIGERSNDGSQPLVPLNSPGYEVDRPSEGETNLTNVHAGFAYEHVSERMRFKSITTAQIWNLDPYRNTIVLPPALVSELESRTAFLAQEFQLASHEESDGLGWTTGLAFKGINRTILTKRMIPGFGTIDWSDTDLDSRGMAVSAAIRFEVFEGVRTSVGLKVDGQRSSIDRLNFAPPLPPVEQSHTDTAALPFVSVESPVTARIPWSVSAYSGWKPGGYTAFSDQPDLIRFQLERTMTLEGSVATSEDRAIELTIYATRSNNTQIERSFTETDYLIRNADSANILGTEIVGHHQFRKNLVLGGRASWTRAVFDTYVDPFNGVDFSGNRLPYVPEYALNLALDYQPSLGLAGGLRVDCTGPVSYEEANEAFFTQDTWVTAAAWVSWRWPRADLTASGTNLSNEFYYTSIVPGIFHGVPVLPRRLSLRFRWVF